MKQCLSMNSKAILLIERSFLDISDAELIRAKSIPNSKCNPKVDEKWRSNTRKVSDTRKLHLDSDTRSHCLSKLL